MLTALRLNPCCLGPEILVALAVTALCRPSLRSEDVKLPSARELIQETKDFTTTDETPNSWVLNELATAHAHLGEFEAARKLLRTIEQDYLTDSALAKIAEIELVHTGATGPLPDSLNRDLPDSSEFEQARIYAKHGDPERALKHIRAIKLGRASVLQFMVASIIEPLMSAGHGDAAREILLRWAECFSDTRTTFDYKPWDKIDQLVGLLNDLGEKDKAKAFCERWHHVMASDTDLDEHGSFIGKGWANLGSAWFRIGEKTKAEEAFELSRIWLEKARVNEKEPDQPHKLIHYAELYANLAAKREAALGLESAQAIYELAYYFASLVVPSKYECYGFQRVVETQLENNDPLAAIRTAGKVQDHRWQATCWHLISEHAQKHRNSEAAKIAARNAAQLLLDHDFKPFMAHDIARVAKTVANSGETELAKQLFQQAIRLSNAADDPKFHHHWIARMQVSAGQLNDAYKTIGEIAEPDSRVLPLAQLACAIASQEFDVTKSAASK